MATRWQQLGAFVGEIGNVSYERLERFRDVGGRWVVPLISQVGYPPDHDPACVRNRANLLHFKEWCLNLGIACGGWFMCWALNEAAADAAEIERYVRGYNLMPVVLNCELAYKEHPNELPYLFSEVRKRIRTRSIAASVIDLNDSMIWNGGGLGHSSSCYHLGIRVAPQWYSSPRYAGSHWFHPDLNMMWLKEHGNQGNFYDPDAPSDRAVPLSFVHGTLEVTGLEGASLSISIAELKEAKKFGFTYGFSIYLLESMPESDFALLEQVRGTLFKV